jgi:pimeloyl-ACP methyl ester carboxylesterase
VALPTRVIERGAGPPIVLLHGGALGCSADDWRDVMAPLADAGFRAIAFDQPGFGAFEGADDISLAARSAFTIALLDALGVERATLVGHSQAGRFVFNAALESAARVAAGVILCTGSLLPPLDGGSGAPEIAPPTHEPSPAETRAYLEGAVADRARIGDDLVAIYQRYSHGRNFTNAVQRASSPQVLATRPAAWERLAEPAPPLMLIYGAQDRGRVPERIALARARYPQLPIHLLEACGHFAQWDRPHDVVRLVTAFAGH